MPKKPAAPKAKKTTTAPAPAVTGEKPILYVKAGVTPGWKDLWVWDVKAKRYVADVAEANAVEGWFDQAVRDDQGNLTRRGSSIALRRVRKSIRIDRRPKT